MNVWTARAVPGGPAKADVASSGSLTLGLDKAGRIVIHDESVYPLADPGESLLGTTFKDLIVDPFQSAHFEQHLDPARSFSEVSTVLTLRTAQGGQAAASGPAGHLPARRDAGHRHHGDRRRADGRGSEPPGQRVRPAGAPRVRDRRRRRAGPGVTG